MNPDYDEAIPEWQKAVRIMDGIDSIILVKENVRSNGTSDYLIAEEKSGSTCLLTFQTAEVTSSCDNRGKQCIHILPALELGIGHTLIQQALTKDDPTAFALPVYHDSGILISIGVVITPLNLKSGRFGEVSVSTPLDGIGKHTQSHRSLGTIKHVVGMVGSEDNFLSIKTMVSAWCQSLCNDLKAQEFRPGTDQYGMCKSNRHQPARGRAYSQPTVVQLSTMCITGLCPKCFTVYKVAELDVPVPF